MLKRAFVEVLALQLLARWSVLNSAKLGIRPQVLFSGWSVPTAPLADHCGAVCTLVTETRRLGPCIATRESFMRARITHSLLTQGYRPPAVHCNDNNKPLCFPADRFARVAHFQNMWSTVRSTAARQLRVSRAAKVNTGVSLSSLVAQRPASFFIPTAYRFVLSSRRFSNTGDQLAAGAAAKPRAKRSATTAAKKKATGKKSAGRKKAKKAKKAAPKKRVRKVLTPEEKTKLDVRNLKKIALLDEPKRVPDQAWLVYVAQNMKHVTKDTLGATVKGLASQYNSMGSFEKEVCAAPDTTRANND